MAANKHAAEDLITLDSEKNFLFTEAFKTLRTNLSFCMSSRENHRIAVTSSIPSAIAPSTSAGSAVISSCLLR